MKFPDRVLISADPNSGFALFHHAAMLAWRRLGFEPVFVYVEGNTAYPATSSFYMLDKGDPAPNMLQGKFARMYATKFWPQSTVILSDIDMIPMQSSFFQLPSHYMPGSLVSYGGDAYPPDSFRLPISYLAATGDTFSSLLDFRHLSFRDFCKQMTANSMYKEGNNLSDELCYTRYFRRWPNWGTHLIRVGRFVGSNRRIDRMQQCRFDRAIHGEYIDAHLPRPYSSHVAVIANTLCHVLFQEFFESWLAVGPSVTSDWTPSVHLVEKLVEERPKTILDFGCAWHSVASRIYARWTPYPVQEIVTVVEDDENRSLFGAFLRDHGLPDDGLVAAAPNKKFEFNNYQ